MAEAPPRIAIVDDEPGVLKALSRLLRVHGLRTQSFGSGREFLASLPGGLPVCLIVDFQMPEVNGLELHQHLVSNDIQIPTILISAHDEAALHEREGHFVACLRKPVLKEALFSAIDRAISRAESTRL
jgi:FixJ family two-component response regulator